jgi:hypothetical protein
VREAGSINREALPPSQRGGQGEWSPRDQLAKVRSLASSFVRADRRSIDWRGWLTLAWALWWGWAYAAMVWRIKGPQVLAWISSLNW